MTPSTDWWRHGVLYQIYPRSFADSDGDGTGDLRGITSRLDHLEWLGIDGVWLNPTMPSPNDDWGYDVADYRGVHPDLGTMEDLEELIARARERSIRVLLDLVPNHTSSAHPWYVDSASGRDSEHRDYYVWADPAPGGGPPNNWISNFGGSAWTLDEATGQYGLHQFLQSQPDLNWWDERVRQEFDDILRFWFDRGVAGFRIDVAHSMVKDRELRDDPEATAADHPQVRARGLRQVYSMNRPEGHDVMKRWRGVCAERGEDEPILVGESYVLDIEQLIPFYGSGEDELHLAFNFLFVHADLAAEPMRTIVEGLEERLPPASWPVWTGSNHDAGRLTTRWAGGDEAKARCALLVLLCLRGTAFLYAGDEIALADGVVAPERWKDPVGITSGDPQANRDGCRTPMVWADRPGGGFTPDGVEPWLPLADTSRNVADQREDPRSTLNLVRDLIVLRRASADLHAGAYATLPAPDGAWAWRRGERHVVAVNLSDLEVAVDLPASGSLVLSTDRLREGEPVEGAVALGPWSGAVVVLDG